MTGPVISLSQVTKDYKLYDSSGDRAREALSLRRKRFHKAHCALKEIDLEINRGEILGVVGRNGSGKSTLLKLIAGVLQPTSGTVSVEGKVTALLELGAGFNPEFTGMENIYFYASILGLTEREISEQESSIIEFAEIGEYIDQPVKTYSSGMRARLSFAVAIHVDPEILILDEVLSVGDALFRRKCYAKMEELFSSGKTIIYVSHNADSVRSLCTRALLLHDSRVALDGNPAEVTKIYEKILFSRNDNAAKILEKHKSKEALGRDSADSDGGELSASQEFEKEYFIENFHPKSTVDYENAGVHIQNNCFKTQNGTVVNVLFEGEEYFYCYDVVFEQDCSLVSFNFMLKNMNGSKISGSAMHLRGENIRFVPAGAVVQVSWKFDCKLNEGTYLTNAGVVTTENGEQEFLARKVDANVFKVIGSEDSMVNGTVNLNQEVSFSVS